MEYCALCGKQLREFKRIVDWKSRRYHRKCYAEVRDNWRLEQFYKELVKKNN